MLRWMCGKTRRDMIRNEAVHEMVDVAPIEEKLRENRLSLRERAQVEQLLRYIVEEAPEDAEKRRSFKFPFIACEIFTCEVDIILKSLVEDEELMNYLFSFLEPEHSHSTLLAGYFSKVVVCLLLRKTVPFMKYIQAHQEIIRKLVDLIGITSIMEVLIRLIGADEHLYTTYTDSLKWLDDTDVLEMIVDKFSASDCPEVHANAAETLCAITRYAPPGLAAKISSPSFIGRLFRHALEDLRPNSVLVNSLSVFISLLDPRRLTLGTYHMYSRQLNSGSTTSANPETVEGMLGSLGDVLKLLDVSSVENVLLTTYGKLQPPLGKHRLKIIEFISVLMTVSSEAVEKEMIRLCAVKRILDLFFEYPYNNFLHHHVEHIIMSCLESKSASFIEHLLNDCNLVGKILEAEANFTLAADPDKPTIPAEGKLAPRIGNIGHTTRISNKLVQVGNNNSDIQAYLQENSEWVDWHANVLVKRNSLENVQQWACGENGKNGHLVCWDVVSLGSFLGSIVATNTALEVVLKKLKGVKYVEVPRYETGDCHASVVLPKIVLTGHRWWRPTALHDRTRDSDDDDYQDRDYDVAALANNLSQAFRYGIYGNDDIEEAHGSLERDDEDVYFDDESAEVVLSSLRLGDDRESGSLFTNSNWFAFEDDRTINELSADSIASPSPNIDDSEAVNTVGDAEVIIDKDEDLADTATSQPPEPNASSEPTSVNFSGELSETGAKESENPPEWVEWRETSDSVDSCDLEKPSISPNGEVQVELGERNKSMEPTVANPSLSSADASIDDSKMDSGGSPDSTDSSSKPFQAPDWVDDNPNSDPSCTSVDLDKPVATEGSSGAVEKEEKVEVGIL
ncbi:hypothetical protein RHMOL_Rhmol02G0200300 [Rhododendron molle]|uniref:Uncharacterized protein n=1 Tax=Rhododendron molle TaxID=49168 RepID=A0ACC0PV73_RHOML|nr:hypothetical protein RHMOL_Rhmol02G0200300 [Rhododendron molle]